MKSNPAWYFEKAHPAFLAAKQSIESLMAINQKVMYETATDLHQRANRAVMPGVVAFVSALVFAFLFSYFINHYMVNPIIEITNALKQYRKTGRPVNVHVETKDEIATIGRGYSRFYSKFRKIKRLFHETPCHFQICEHCFALQRAVSGFIRLHLRL